MDYFAHSENDNKNKHLLAKHLRETALLAESFAGREEYKPLFRLSGLLHDLGKYQSEFQRGKPKVSDLHISHVKLWI